MRGVFATNRPRSILVAFCQLHLHRNDDTSFHSSNRDNKIALLFCIIIYVLRSSELRNASSHNTLSILVNYFSIVSLTSL